MCFILKAAQRKRQSWRWLLPSGASVSHVTSPAVTAQRPAHADECRRGTLCEGTCYGCWLSSLNIQLSSIQTLREFAIHVLALVFVAFLSVCLSELHWDFSACAFHTPNEFRDFFLFSFSWSDWSLKHHEHLSSRWWRVSSGGNRYSVNEDMVVQILCWYDTNIIKKKFKTHWCLTGLIQLNAEMWQYTSGCCV